MLSFRYPPSSLAELRNDILRISLGVAYSLRPRRLSALPSVLAATLRTVLGWEAPDSCLDGRRPVPRCALGFVGICGTLDPETLMRGFRKGLFPFSHVGSKKWWMPPNRMTVVPHLIKRDKDVRRLIRNKRYRVTFDTRFEDVMRECAAPRKGRVPLTWITQDIIEAYCRLHRAGHAHSFEAWNSDGELVGGGFGIAVGPIFVIESQFTRQRNASKVAMITLMRHLSAWGFALADGKAHTGYLESMGFRLMPRAEFADILEDDRTISAPGGSWSVDETLDASAEWAPASPAATPVARRATPPAVGPNTADGPVVQRSAHWPDPGKEKRHAFRS